MNKKLVKVRTTRMDTLEAMATGCACGYCDPCNNCSGGGTFTAEGNNYMISRNAGNLKPV